MVARGRVRMKSKDRRGVHGVRVGLGVEVAGVERPLGDADPGGRALRIDVDAGEPPAGPGPVIVGIIDRRGTRSTPA